MSDPTFRFEYATGITATFSSGLAWDTAVNGRPSKGAITRFLDSMNESMERGGCNDHMRRADPTCFWSRGRIVRQSTGRVMCEAWASGTAPVVSTGARLSPTSAPASRSCSTVMF